MTTLPHHRAVAARLAAEADIYLTPACVETVERFLAEARPPLDLGGYELGEHHDG